MNKIAIKNFAIWARNKLIADISYKAGLLGITEKGIKSPLPQSTQTVQFFDIGTKEPSSITGIEIQQRKKLVEEIERKAKQSDYTTAYINVIEEVAYTWFNRLIAIRFMEVNDYLPTRIRVLSSESNGKAEPDLVTHALEANLDYSAYEKDRIIQLKHENKLDDLFRMLFIKQCNALNANLPKLFEKTSDYTELLLNVSFTDKEGVIYHLINDIDEDDFNVSKEGQVEIIGWLYQYYNTEPKDEVFALLKKNVKITKERVPAATQLFTPDWIVRYMVENSLGRLWLEGHPNDELKANWKYYLDEAEQEEEVRKQLDKLREDFKNKKPEDIKVIDPAMGSGHILVYAFDVLIQIYESYGYSQRDAAKNIIENNLYGLDIDNRAYQLAYFAVMMKARQHNRRILNADTTCHVYAFQESNEIKMNQLKYFGVGLSEMDKNAALLQVQGLLDTFTNAKEFGSILNIENYNWELLRKFINVIEIDGQMSLDTIGVEHTKAQIYLLIEIGEAMAQKYDVVVTNPPYMGSKGMTSKLSEYVQARYPDSKSDLFAVFIEKCGELLKPKGYQAMITQHAWMFITSFEKLRSKIMTRDIVNMAHLGTKAFEEIGGEVVQTTAFVLASRKIAEYKGNYARLVNFGSQNEKEAAFLRGEQLYSIASENFCKIPGNPIAYWMRLHVFDLFTSNPSIKKFVSYHGILTGKDELFIRFWWEPSFTKINTSVSSKIDFEKCKEKFYPLAKGGEFRRYYGNNDLVIWYDEEGQNLINKMPTHGFGGSDYYFSEGITWSELFNNNFNARKMTNSIFSLKGPSLFADKSTLYYILALFNTKVSNYLLGIINPTISTGVGVVSKLPFIYEKSCSSRVETMAEKNTCLCRADWDSFETSWDFKVHPLVELKEGAGYGMDRSKWGYTIKFAFENWKKSCNDRFVQLKANEEELNRIFIDIYGLNDELTPEIEDKDVTVRSADLGREIRSLISYAVGCMVGRYSLDYNGLAYAGGKWNNSISSYLPDKDNILPITDEVYFQDDIVGRFIEFVKVVYGSETLEENLKFIANALDGKGNNSIEIIRNYFVRDFFKDHCKIYQKRPIYWLFDSGKQNGFKALVYMHRYDENTIGNLRIDYLHRMQRIYENEIARMQDTIENSKDAREVTAATKRKEKLIKQLQETKEYDQKIAHLALARTSIDLDDGVKVNYEKVQTDRDGKKLDVLAKI